MTARPTGGFGGDETQLSPFTTADPIPETIVRRDAEGFVRGLNLHTLLGVLQVGDIKLYIPLLAPPDETFLKHNSDGELEWVPPSALAGAVEWGQIINTPSTLQGYGIIATFPEIGGVAARAQLPPELAYEDEANTFTQTQTIEDLVAPDFEALMRQRAG